MTAGGKDLFIEQKLLPLRGRSVKLYPYAGAYDFWLDKAKAHSHIVPLPVRALVERSGVRGMDIADVLVRAAQAVIT